VAEGAVHRDRQVNLRIRLLSITVLWALRKSGWILWLAKRVLRVLRARLVRLVPKANRVLRVPKARRVSRVKQGHRALLVPPELPGLRDRRVSRVFRGLRGYRAKQGLPGRRERPDPKDRKARKETLALPE
jgi:hypothetical protein